MVTNAGDAPLSLPRTTGIDALENWWSELPDRERSQALRLPAGVPLPEEFVVGLLLSGFDFPARLPGPSAVDQPEALRKLLERENSRRRDITMSVDQFPVDGPAEVGLVRRVLRCARPVGPRRVDV